MPQRPTEAMMTVGERRRAVAGPVPLPKISPTSWPDDIIWSGEWLDVGAVWTNVEAMNYEL